MSQQFIGKCCFEECINDIYTLDGSCRCQAIHICLICPDYNFADVKNLITQELQRKPAIGTHRQAWKEADLRILCIPRKTENPYPEELTLLENNPTTIVIDFSRNTRHFKSYLAKKSPAIRFFGPNEMNKFKSFLREFRNSFRPSSK